ncbi:ESX secretion-associated protein EspG [Saccharomonospora xinjiangensis]|uniref:ESX secretion-associated protein EspG n=1 Tax=Saccharomonospora xinjiangensis TaxID=75294 RepID=UPI00106F3F71|nr:ESX secretion-associated protein EspG [Saccharomonospora xinjiangensis]QBQ62275.1 hypothetical protein EYD13_19685 [Saccharomonospora xinjiangensis]
MIAATVDVPRAALQHAWGLEGLGEPHPILGRYGLHLSDDGNAELTRRCLSLLAGVGLATAHALTPAFRDTMRTLAMPAREFYCWSSFADSRRDSATLVATRDGTAVGAVVRGETVTLWPIDPQQVIAEFLATLPDVKAAPVHALTVPRSDLDGRPSEEDGGSRSRAQRRREAGELKRHLAAVREGAHQLYVAVTVGGVRSRSSPLSLIDVAGLGRVLLFRDGGDRINFRPGRREVVAEALIGTMRGL